MRGSYSYYFYYCYYYYYYSIITTSITTIIQLLLLLLYKCYLFNVIKVYTLLVFYISFFYDVNSIKESSDLTCGTGQPVVRIDIVYTSDPYLLVITPQTDRRIQIPKKFSFSE